MEEFIISETNKVFTKAIKRFSKEDQIEETEVSILLAKNEEQDEVSYKICHHHVPVKETTMMKILGVRIDLKGYSLLLPPQIKKIIENFGKELNSKAIEIGVYLSREEEDEVIYFLYNNGTLVREVFLKDVLKIELT